MSKKWNIKILGFIGMLLYLSFPAYSQVQDNFETGNLQGWYSEGDGAYSLASNLGNPGSSLKVQDDATGDINYAIAPGRYLGNWSNYSSTDSIVVDIYVQSTNQNTLIDPYPVFELVGPGGRATILQGLTLPRNTWNHIVVQLDSMDWTIESGTWESLLEDISLLRIRAEYINGFESVYLDNILLSFSPIRGAIQQAICSSFEDGTYDGWRFEESGSISLDSTHGNPGIGVGLNDKGVVITQALAPPKFLGNWSPLLDSGYLRFDLKINNTSSGFLFNKTYLVRLSGNNSVAQVRPPDSVLQLAIGQWHSFSFPIESNKWTVSRGSWDSLLLAVEEIRLELEFINGLETASFDNFCIVPKRKGTTSSRLRQKLNLKIFPNPSSGSLIIRSPGTKIKSVFLYDVAGRRIPANITYKWDEILVYTDYKGLAIIKADSDEEYSAKKVLFR